MGEKEPTGPNTVGLTTEIVERGHEKLTGGVTELVGRAGRPLGRVVQTRPVVAFFVLTFAYSWGLFTLLYDLLGPERLAVTRSLHAPFAWGPPIAAIAVVHFRGGDVRSWLWAVADPRTNVRWYGLAVLAALLFTNGDIVAGLAGTDFALAQPVSEIAAVFLFSLVLAGALEEFGWRGFAQSHLQERYNALVAAVVVGITFGVWHYPWLLLGGAGYESAGVGMLVTFPIGTVLLSVVFAWLFTASGGVVPVVMVAHATVNATPLLEVAGTVPGWVSTLEGLLLLGAVTLPILVYGRAYLAASGPDSDLLEHARRHSDTVYTQNC